MAEYEQIGTVRMPIDAPDRLNSAGFDPAYASDRSVGLPLSSWEPDVTSGWSAGLPWWVWLAGLIAVTVVCVGIVLYVADRGSAGPEPGAGRSQAEQQSRQAAASHTEVARASRPVCEAR